MSPPKKRAPPVPWQDLLRNIVNQRDRWDREIYENVRKMRSPAWLQSFEPPPPQIGGGEVEEQQPPTPQPSPEDPPLTFAGASLVVLSPGDTPPFNFRFRARRRPFDLGTRVTAPTGPEHTVDILGGDIVGQGAFGGVVGMDEHTVVKFNFKPENPRYQDNVADSLDEAVMMSKLSHPNIVGFVAAYLMETDSASSDPLTLLVMERCLCSLSALMLFTDEALEERHRSFLRGWEADTLRGLAYLHARGVVHRDVKPDNVLLVAAEGGRLTAKLGDLGLSTMGVRDEAAGTPAFVAPEFHPFRMLTEESDIWSWAVTFFKTYLDFMPFNKVLLPIHNYVGGYADPFINGKARTRGADISPMMDDPLPLPEPNFRAMVNYIKVSTGNAPPIPGDLMALFRRCFVLNPIQRPSAEDLLSAARYSGLGPTAKPRIHHRQPPPSAVRIEGGDRWRCKLVVRSCPPSSDEIPNKTLWGGSDVQPVDPEWLYQWGIPSTSRVVRTDYPITPATGSLMGSQFECLDRLYRQRRGFGRSYTLGPDGLVMCFNTAPQTSDPVVESKRMAAVTSEMMEMAVGGKWTRLVPIYSVEAGIVGLTPFIAYTTERATSLGDSGMVAVDVLAQLADVCVEFQKAGLAFPSKELIQMGVTSWLVVMDGRMYLDPGFMTKPFEPAPANPFSAMDRTADLWRVLHEALGPKLIQAGITKASVMTTASTGGLRTHPILRGRPPLEPRRRVRRDTSKLFGLRTIPPRDLSHCVVRYDFGRQ